MAFADVWRYELEPLDNEDVVSLPGVYGLVPGQDFPATLGGSAL